MRDAQADIGRRAWTACPRCADHRGCSACGAGRNCESHWRFVLATEARQVFVQCPGCWHRWWHDTRFGVGDRPAHIDAEPEFPADGQAAA